MQNSDSNSPFLKGPKRKRLAKACDACHKSKRRCDGTATGEPGTSLCSQTIVLMRAGSYYASKQCTYTDASGRPVPAPRPFKPEKQDPQPSSSTSDPDLPHFSPISERNSDDEHKHPRKRFRNERGILCPGASVEQPPAIELDPALTRELTNRKCLYLLFGIVLTTLYFAPSVFFTHCHPARVIVHKPTFSSALSHNRVPSHLLLAVCALAAPLSKQPRIRTTPSRFAGKPFAQEALSQMFDGAGRLVVEPDLAAAQALCILQMHDILTEETNSIWSSRFHDLALQIVEGLGVHSPEHPTLTPVPSQEFVQRAIEREALRRIFWLIHFLDVMASIYFKKPVTFAENELRLRLPVDETSFELGVHSTLPEYLYLPAVRTQYASEFGHLIRIISIYAKMEFALDDITDTETNTFSAGALMEAEQRMEDWDRTLPDHLRFSEESLQVQQSMFETSSNGGAWCWCCIHLYHASCALVLNIARQRTQRGSKNDREPPWAIERIELILKMLGDRAKNSILMGSALWSLIKYCKRDDPQIRKWASEYEDAYGTRVFEMVQDWRSQPSPPQLHQYPSHSHSHSQPLQSQQSQTHHLPQQPSHNSHHPSSYHTQHKHQLPHRRLSDVRTSGPFTLSHSGTSNSPRHPASDAYGVGGGGAMNSTSAVMKRSPSHSPPISYSLGRPLNAAPSNGAAPPRHAALGNGQATYPAGLATRTRTRCQRPRGRWQSYALLPGGPGSPHLGGSSSALDAGLALQPQPPAQQAGLGVGSTAAVARAAAMWATESVPRAGPTGRWGTRSPAAAGTAPQEGGDGGRGEAAIWHAFWFWKRHGGWRGGCWGRRIRRAARACRPWGRDTVAAVAQSERAVGLLGAASRAGAAAAYYAAEDDVNLREYAFNDMAASSDVAELRPAPR
ncbi:fungal-specific transcription factor domain-containing protein [Pholiota molesta]|nr:fungal-specific transcription factor domain-containing protein [Pholiota molesta]